MSTNAMIGVAQDDGKAKCIYCHWDGYISHVGAILCDDYTDKNKIDQLIALGDLSSLGSEIGPENDFNKQLTEEGYYDAHKNICCAYHRDRGEELNIRTMPITELAKAEQYNYLYKDNEWFVSCSKTHYKFQPLLPNMDDKDEDE